MFQLHPIYNAILAAVCAGAMFWRFLYIDRNYFFIGRSFGYLIFVVFYIWRFIAPNDPNSTFWGRWSVFVFLAIHAVYYILEVLKHWKNSRNATSHR